MASFECPACLGYLVSETLKVPEQYFGTGEVFLYDKCADCGTLSLRDVPVNLGDYYGSEYYSFEKHYKPPDHAAYRAIRRFRSHYCLGTGTAIHRLIGSVLTHFTERPEVIEKYGTWLHAGGIGPRSKIADIGCGEGSYIKGLYHEGFDFVFGFDPFLSAPCQIGSSSYIVNTEMAELPIDLDMIIMNHSLEHVLRPRTVLRECREHLSEGGYLLIQMPVADNNLVALYGIHWVGLDAPRHIQIFSQIGAARLLEISGYEILSSQRYTHIFQWAMSEQLARGVPLVATSLGGGSLMQSFTPHEVRNLRERATLMQASGEGDCITLFARRR